MRFQGQGAIAPGQAGTAAPAAAAKHHWWKSVGLWLIKAKVWLVLVLKPLGCWGLLLLATIDSAAIPLPFLDPLIVSYGLNDHAKAILYCLMGALGSATGSLLPYYLGRAGGELILLKRINRERYEKLRDRFAKQEFLAIMVPAMLPPPMSLKPFELAAGIFEMRPVTYLLAIFSGKFVRFGIESIIVIIYGPEIFHTMIEEFHHHTALMQIFLGIALGMLLLWVVRKIFDRKTGIPLPGEGRVETEFEN